MSSCNWLSAEVAVDFLSNQVLSPNKYLEYSSITAPIRPVNASRPKIKLDIDKIKINCLNFLLFLSKKDIDEYTFTKKF